MQSKYEEMQQQLAQYKAAASERERIMAGSYRHLLSGWDLIENMGDAYEAVEELMWLVQSQIGTDEAERLMKEQYYPMRRGEIPRDEHLKFVERKMKNMDLEDNDE